MDDERVLSFVRSAIKSAWSLELLLLLHRDPQRAWSRDALVQELRGSEHLVRDSVQTLGAAALIDTRDDRVRYAPPTAQVAELVDALVELYSRKPIEVLRTIFTSPSDKIRSFADAFLFRKDREE